MTEEKDLSIAELEDKPDTVYVFGVASNQPPSVHKWMNDGFEDLWHKKFKHAEVLTVPGMTGITEVQQTTKENLEAMLESVDRDTKEKND